MKYLVFLIGCTTILSGCIAQRPGLLSQEEIARQAAEVQANRELADKNFPRYIEVCKEVFPDAEEVSNDGGRHMSDQRAVNVALTSKSRSLVCSVSLDTTNVERIYHSNRTFSLSEYKSYIEKNPTPETTTVTANYEPDPPKTDPRLSYKNTRLGDSMARFSAKLPAYNCKAMYCVYARNSCESVLPSGLTMPYSACEDSTSYGGAKPKGGVASFIDGKLAKIALTIKTDQMAMLDATLTEKYGKPAQVDNAPFINKMGTSFPNTVKKWVIQGEKLILTYRQDVIDEGQIVITGKAAETQSKELRERHIKSNSKDF